MIPGVDPRIDFAFKKLFGTSRNRSLTVSLLNAVLEGTGRAPIEDVELLDTHDAKDAAGGKLSIVDVRARTSDGRRFIVEMQMLVHRDLVKRLLYYWARGYSAQLHKADDYTRLEPTILICILDEVLFPQPTPYHMRFRLSNVETRLVFAEDIELHTIELPKLTAANAAEARPLDRWSLFLKEAERLDAEALPASLRHAEIQQAMEVLTMIRENEGEWLEYESRLLRVLDERTLLKQSREEGREEGRCIGRIQLLQELLLIPVTHKEELSQKSIDELEGLAGELSAQLRSRASSTGE